MKLQYFKAKDNILSMKISSEITGNKFRAICSEIEQASATLGKVRLVLVFKHYPSLNSAEDLYNDFRFVKLYANCIDNINNIPSFKFWLTLFFCMYTYTLYKQEQYSILTIEFKSI